MNNEIKQNIKTELLKIFKEIGLEEQNVFFEKPKVRSMGDIALPCFNYSKILKISPIMIANTIKERLNNDYIWKTESVGGYLNIFLNKSLIAKQIMEKIRNEKNNYANNEIGKDKMVVLDYSSPNIAKPFGVGHLRSTVIGNAMRNICQKNGYNTFGINYLGDFGTQFGKLIYAYKNWGNKEAIDKNTIDELKRLYVLFHQRAEEDPSLEEEGRRWFKKLEDNDEEALSLWRWFREESLNEFQKTYDLLEINNFDSYDGEAFYNDKMFEVIDELNKKQLLELDEGAQIVRLDDLPPALIRKNDGATLYMTRDLAALFYRKKNYKFDEILYVVGNEQTLHFNQLKTIVKKMNYDWYNQIHHLSFGMILQDGKKMATRQGKTIKLHDVLLEAINLAKNYIKEKNPNLINQEEISKEVGVGAVIFNDLKNYRTNDIEFNLQDILKFEGETGPYVQYTNARICSILENQKINDFDYEAIEYNEYIWYLILRLIEFEEVIINSKEEYDPSKLAKYLILLAQDFNKYYASERILSDDENKMNFNLLLATNISIILKEGLRLLGIKTPSKM